MFLQKVTKGTKGGRIVGSGDPRAGARSYILPCYVLRVSCYGDPSRAQRMWSAGDACHVVGAHSAPCSRNDQRGSVLIIALWALVFLGALAVSVGTRAAASIRLAEHIKVISSLDHVARAGVERAVAAVRSGDEEILSGVGSEYWSRANEDIEGAVFSVVSSVTSPGQPAVTNFGVVCESVRTNINSMAQVRSLLAVFANRGSSAGIEENIRKYRIAKKELTKGLSNGRFESVYELLLIEGVTEDLFETIRPYITVYDRNCFSGISKASFSNGVDTEDMPRAERWVAFVYDTKKNMIVYWEQ